MYNVVKITDGFPVVHFQNVNKNTLKYYETENVSGSLIIISISEEFI